MLLQLDFILKKKGENNICKVYDSPSLGKIEELFRVTTNGIEDIDEETKRQSKNNEE